MIEQFYLPHDYKNILPIQMKVDKVVMARKS